MDADVRLLLDQFVPEPHVRERHVLGVRAPAALTLEVARDFAMRSLPLVRLIIWLRAVLLRATPAADDPPVGLMTEMQGLGWGVLLDVPGRLVVAGAHCQPWRGDVVFTAIDGEEFAAFSEPDRVKIVWTLEAMPLGPTFTRLASETRVRATDSAAHTKFLRYWRRFSVGIILIRWLLLRAVRRDAERRWRRERETASSRGDNGHASPTAG